MNTFSPALQLFLSLAKIQTIMARKFDSTLGGLSEDEFIILSLLAKSPDGRMRRIDLAEAAGLTAAGVTRLFLPMEKLGLVSREENKRDARVSYIILAIGGQRKLVGAIERAELLVSGLLPPENIGEVEKSLVFLKKIEKLV